MKISESEWHFFLGYLHHEGWLYLAVVVDLFSRKIIGWSMQSRMTKDIVLNALLMAIWRRNPLKQVLVHSDQGSQYTSHEWQSFLKSHGLEGRHLPVRLRRAAFSHERRYRILRLFRHQIAPLSHP